MAAKKAASKKAATKKGDEPVRMGRKQTQQSKYISDPLGWMNPGYFKGAQTTPGTSKYGLVPKNAQSEKMGKQATKEAKKLVEQSKKKYGSKFLVGISPDTGVYLKKSGSTLKGDKAQSARMTAQATAAKKAAAKRPSKAANTRRVAKGKK